MKTILGCIADDFTGATDVAGLLARSGADVSLRIGIPADPPAETSDFEVIALKSRTAPVDQAVSEACAALNWLRAAGAKRFFWKYCSTFDSTPDGNIGPVAEALMEALETDQTIYCPAFPENGRSIFMGNLFVGRQPLSESPMKDHPLTPMRDSNLMRLLEPQVRRPVGLVDRLSVAKGAAQVASALADLRSKDVAHVVVDAVANEDLDTIAEACCDMPLITGGSAIAMPLPGLYRANDTLSGAGNGCVVPPLGSGAVVLSGSCSAMTNLQVSHYQSRGKPAFRLDPITLVEDGVDDVLNWLRSQDLTLAPLVFATAEPERVRAAQDRLGMKQAGAIVEQTLADCATVARQVGASRFVVAGGETSGAVTKSLGVDSLKIGQEIAPGVPWTFSRSDGEDIALALKSGNFGSESFFSQALDMLEAT